MLAISIVAAMLAAVAPAPTKAASAKEKLVAESAAVTAIEIPVHVTGRDGKPVPNLQPSDFELSDDGKRQTISAVDVIDLRTIPASQTPPMARRHWLLVFDLSYTSPRGLARARDGARDFVERATLASDLVGVATVSVEHGWKLLVNFTRDRVQLAHAVASVGSSFGGLAPLDPLGFQVASPAADLAVAASVGKSEAKEVARDAARGIQRGDDARERGRITQLVGVLGGVARTLDSVRGRKHVLYFSEGFDSALLGGTNRAAVPTSNERSAPNADTANEQAMRGEYWKIDSDTRFGSTSSRGRVGDALQAFRRSDTVLHTVDVAGLTTSVSTGDSRRNGRDSLFLMANETEGELVQNANELSGELQKVADRTSLVYVLVYQPQKLDKPGAYHALRVKVNVAGARVSARAGYYEPRPFAAMTPVERQLSTGDLLTGGGANALSLSILATPFPAERGAALVPVVMELPGGPLLAGVTAARIPVQFYTYAIDGAGSMRDYATQELTLDLAQLRSSLEAGGIKYYVTLSLPPGEFTIRAVVRNVATGRAGNASATLTVPGMPGGAPYVAAPLFEAPPSGWLLVKRPPTAGEPNPEYPFAVGAETFIPAADPVIELGRESRIAVVTYNFPGGDTLPPLDVRMEIADAVGKVWPGTARTLGQTRVEKGTARKFVLGFAPEGLTPGKYRMTIAVSEKASGASAEGSAPFEVRAAAPAAATAASGTK